MKRRSFLGALAGLPLVGRLVARDTPGTFDAADVKIEPLDQIMPAECVLMMTRDGWYWAKITPDGYEIVEPLESPSPKATPTA